MEAKAFFARINTAIGAGKIYIWFAAALVGTNGIQAKLNHEASLAKHIEETPIEKHTIKPVAVTTTIIYKLDKEYCDKQIAAAIKNHLNTPRH